MTDQNLTELVCCLDRSGSMVTILDDAIGGFNAMLEDQQKTSGCANMTIVMFNDKVKVLEENTPLKDVKPFTTKTYRPNGSTSLNDAIGITIDRLGKRYAALPEGKRPGKVLFIILTDGCENSSKQYTHDQIASMIQHQQEKYNWQFMYLSADLQAFDHAQHLNIMTSVYYTCDSASVGNTYGVVSNAVKQFRSSGGMSITGQSIDLGTRDESDINKAQ